MHREKDKCSSRGIFHSNMEFIPHSEDGIFALGMAVMLDDLESLAFHYDAQKKYPREAQLRAFRLTMSYTKGEVHKSRGALYTKLLKMILDSPQKKWN